MWCHEFAYTSSLLLAIIASGQVDMSLDGQEGRQLIRVILQFIMSDDPQLTSKSVKLLIRQFSQRKELIARFKQVRTRVWAAVIGHKINRNNKKKTFRQQERIKYTYIIVMADY